MFREYPVVNLTKTGKNIRKLRKEKNVKIRELAHYLGFSDVQAVYKWERGESLPTLENCFALSKYLNVCIEDILICEDEMSSFIFGFRYKNLIISGDRVYLKYCSNK